MKTRKIQVAIGVVAGCVAMVTWAGAQPTARELLVRLSDDHGGRMTGSVGNAGARADLAMALRELGLEPVEERFMMPGWERGRDEVAMLTPVARPLRVAALAYSGPVARFEGEVVALGGGTAEEYQAGDLTGRVGLVETSATLRGDRLAANAAARGLRALFYVNREAGGLLLARTSSFQGEALPVPILSVTQEEGRWMGRLLARGVPVRVAVEVNSRPREVEGVNLIVRLPGRAESTVVVGAHFDSWDLGQGALDNGLGVAQLYALARERRGRVAQHTVELVWFDGEELGLWGSRIRAANTADAPLVVMLNLDMVGTPIGVNALGADDLVPALTRWNAGRGEAALTRGVENLNWLGSDHTPYQLAGVRALTFNAPIHREAVRYYHDLADTVDKIYPELLEGGGEVIASLVEALAGDTSLVPRRLEAPEVRELFQRFKLEKRLEATGLILP